MTATTSEENKRRIWEYWTELETVSPERRIELHDEYLSPQIHWFGPHPINSITGSRALEFSLYSPLFDAFPDLRRRTDVFFAESFEGSEWISATGYLIGTFSREWLGIPAHGKTAYIRFGEFSRMEEGKITETRILFDLVDLLRQVGIRVLPESPGEERIVPGPEAGDGVLLAARDSGESRKTLELVEAMIFGLGSYDQSNLESMGMEKYWDPQKMVWYGPTGIGTTYGLEGFQKYHQQPFLRAFPDRKGGHHVARLAEGLYAATTGWPSVLATHRGEYLGTPASDRRVQMRVMDWWRREGELLTENWVFIDLPHLFLQFGIDLLKPLHE